MTEYQKQNFIGGLVGSILLKKGVEVAVKRGMEALAKDPQISLQPIEVREATAVVAQAVKKEVVDQVTHSTNTEPAYQSRVAQGSSAAVLMAVATVWQFWTDGVVQGPLEYTPPVLVVVGGLWALYGRFIAKKPFGA